MAADRDHETGLPEVAPVTVRSSAPGGVRIAFVIGAALVLLGIAVATSIAADPPASPAPDADSNDPGSVLPDDPSALAPFAPFFLADPDLEDERESQSDAAGIGRGRDITITAIDGSSVTLKTEDGWTRTIAVTADTELTKGGQAIEVGDLAVGDQVRFRQVRNDDGTYTVTHVAVVVPSIRGTVSDLSATGFKVTTRGGTVWTVTVDGSTRYQVGSADGSRSDVANGSTVVVLGTSTGEHALAATTVRVAPDQVGGTVTATTADTITIETRDGSSVTATVDAETRYLVAGVENADLGDVEVGMRIVVRGRGSDATIAADVVAAGNGRGFFRGGDLKPGRRDLPWPWRGDGDDAAAPTESPSTS